MQSVHGSNTRSGCYVSEGMDIHPCMFNKFRHHGQTVRIDTEM